MASISEIRINGQQSSDVLTPVVAGFKPVFTWDFIEDPGFTSQDSFELSIGDDSVGWGSSYFLGNLFNEVVNSSANSYEYYLNNLSRGVNYYGQIRAFNKDGSSTDWYTFLFMLNQLPMVINYSLSPENPNTSENIDLYYTYFDIDNHDQQGTKIRWYKNGIVQNTYDDLCTLPSSALSVGDVWNAKIVPSDGIEYGSVYETNSIEVISANLSLSNISIFPLDANINDILKVEYDINTSEYFGSVSDVIFEWYINDELVPDSNTKYIRLKLIPGDVVFVVIKITDGETVFSQSMSSELVIQDVVWNVFNLKVNGLTSNYVLSDLTPFVEWNIYKTTAEHNQLPAYFRLLVTKTPSISSSIFDTGFVVYTKNNFVIPKDILQRGKKYFIYVAAGDSQNIDETLYAQQEFQMAGSSWNNLVNNSTGWTIEFKLSVTSSPTADGAEPNMGLYIHDGTYFCTVVLGLRNISFTSSSNISYVIPTSDSNLSIARTFIVAGKNNDVKIFMDNKLILSIDGGLLHKSKLKQIEYGDIDSQNINSGVFYFIRYSTDGAFSFDNSPVNTNTFYFSSIGKLKNGQIQYIQDDIISWLPDDTEESSKLIKFNPNSMSVLLPTVVKNFSPITSIYIDEKRNKYIGTANGVTAIYGEKHDSDYRFETQADNLPITSKDFDKISNVPTSKISNVEPSSKSGWLTIDTTYRSVGVIDEEVINVDEYDPYINNISSRAIHYYSQRTHGHAWYDMVDNEKGWRTSFSFQLEKLEADDYEDTNTRKQGVGLFVNDGAYQEIIYFFEDRISLFYANVFVPVNTTSERDYVITGKNNTLKVYQKLRNSPSTSYSLLVDATGLFNTTSTKTGNSRNPKICTDSLGFNHCVWHDDAERKSQVFYSKFDGGDWSVPESITLNTQFGMKNPQLDSDRLNRIWVAYEDSSWGLTEISVSVKDRSDWNPKIRITNYKSEKRNPTIKVDSDSNVHVVWEDNRNGNWNLYWAVWLDSKQAWISSSQFGRDTAAIDDLDIDEYLTGDSVSYHKPEIVEVNKILWLVYESFSINDNKTLIRLSSLNIENEFYDEATNEITGFTSSVIVSLADRNSKNPSIAASSYYNIIVIVWEDVSEPITQIWGASVSFNGITIESAQQITNSFSNCINPDSGFLNSQCLIVFEVDSAIKAVSYNPNNQSFYGSALGGYDISIEVDANKVVSNPGISNSSSSSMTKIVYDFKQDRDPYLLSSVEFPDFYLIGDAIVEHKSDDQFGTSTTTTTFEDGLVSVIDSKEFAFGDMSENSGAIAHWRDIGMYFGYDASPHSIAKFNTNTVSRWADDRINDIFVDVYGNIIAGTFSGLYYMNVGSTELTNIDGRTQDFSAADESGNILNCNSSVNVGKCLLNNQIVTTVAWGKGIWYAGTTKGLVYSSTAGKIWAKLSESTLGSLIINSISTDSSGNAIVGTNNGLFVAHPNKELISIQQLPDNNIKTVAVDDANIIWAGTDSGLFRIENRIDVLSFNTNQGLRSSHINGISIVNKHLRYIATAAGIERMYGMNFTNFNVTNTDILSDNISKVIWNSKTNSLWVSTLYLLYEIVFRDDSHEIIANEIIHYDNSEISTDINYDKNIYAVLDLSRLQTSSGETLVVNDDSLRIYINKNEIDFGYFSSNNGNTVVFLCNLLPNDQVEVLVSNKFTDFHDFNQRQIERSVKGFLRRSIDKMANTSRQQLLLLSDLDKPSILLYVDNEIGLPFTTISLDRDLPVGCLEKLENITRTKIRFRILAFDEVSGVESYILSNYENFTSDGETPQTFLPFKNIVDHDIGLEINNVFDSLILPDSVTIDNVSYNVGLGSSAGSIVDYSGDTPVEYLFFGTRNPAIIFKLDPATNEWNAISILNQLDSNREITKISTINNVLYVATGTYTLGGFGTIYKSMDGITFEQIGSVTGSHVTSIASHQDGSIYFGSSDGSIYVYKDFILSKPEYLEDIAESIYSIDIFGNILVAGTGNLGKLFTIDLISGDNLIIFTETDSRINNVHIKDSLIAASPEEAQLFISSSRSSSIYRSNLATYDFVKSYSSFSTNINVIKSVSNSVLIEPTDEQVEGSTEVAAIGNSLFKYSNNSWQFFYKHEDDIKDFIEYSTNGINGIWIVSESRITKWTAVVSQKTVYLKLKDRAGNISRLPVSDSDNLCPTDTVSVCCDYAYAIKISDLKNFVNENRVLDVSEYGEIQFTFDSPNQQMYYSADKIDEEIGIYTSEIFNGSNDMISWKSITWDSTEPDGTSVDIQIRSGVNEDTVADSDWSPNLVKNSGNFVSISHITDQYLQFRAILKSSVRDLSPALRSITIRNITAQSSHFFTTNFALPSRPIKGLLTSNTFIPISADVVFGINTNDTTDFGDYQIIEPNRLFTTVQNQFGSNLRIGAKLLSPGIPQLQPTNDPGDPYDARSYICSIDFDFNNFNVDTHTYHFRIRFYNDVFRTQLIHTFYSGNDQTGWSTQNGDSNYFPSVGVELSASQSASVSFNPGDLVEQNQRWYITIQAIDIADASNPDTISNNESYICSACNITNELGLIAEYHSNISQPEMPDFGGLVPAITTVESDINFLPNSGTWITSHGSDLGSDFLDNFAVRWMGRIQIPLDGEYVFELSSQDSSILFIDQEELISQNNIGSVGESQNSIYLTSGFHSIEVQYISTTGDSSIILKWQTPDENDLSAIPANRLYHSIANEYCSDVDSPKIFNLAIVFELENGESVKVNLQ